MKTIEASDIAQTVKNLCISVNCFLPADVENALRTRAEQEPWPIAKNILSDIVENIDLARESTAPLCQDTGLACIFLELGQDVHIIGDTLENAINEGVRQGYTLGYLRKSVVDDPVRRVNTGDNTPAIINTRVVAGDTLKITVAPKGAGSENMSRLAMLKPSDGLVGIHNFVINAVKQAGPNPCPPIVVGVGIGGNFDRVALLAKQALLREIGSAHADPFYAALEREWLCEINALGIGPQGFGGETTALAVHICAEPTHIAMLPAAVNINCHVARHESAVL